MLLIINSVDLWYKARKAYQSLLGVIFKLKEKRNNYAG